MKKIFLLLVFFCSAAIVLAANPPATQPSPSPATQPTETVPMQSDSIMGRMLQTSSASAPLYAEPNPPAVDATSGMATVAPKAKPILLRPEGYYIINRLARLGKTHDGFRDLVFDSDGLAMHDPPMRILPNQIFSSMEDQTRDSSDPLAFRISGYITQYKSRNYILIDKAVPQPRQGNH